MRESEAREIISCLSGDRTIFHYYEGRYASMILSWYLGEGRTVSQIKRSKWAKLLTRPHLRELILTGLREL